MDLTLIVILVVVAALAFDAHLRGSTTPPTPWRTSIATGPGSPSAASAKVALSVESHGTLSQAWFDGPCSPPSTIVRCMARLQHALSP